MDIRIKQQCHQCGGALTLAESDRLLTCGFCGVRSFIQSGGPFRYFLPARVAAPGGQGFVYAPYLRFKGTVFTVGGKGISHRVVDTTQVGCALPGLLPSLGVRPQAMQLRRLSNDVGGRYLRPALKANVVLAKAANISKLHAKSGRDLFHRAYIGESLSYIYLPLLHDKDLLIDGVTDEVLATIEQTGTASLETTAYNPRWQVRFQTTLCPHCGWTLDGETDCRVMTCSNCQSAWELGNRALTKVSWRLVEGERSAALFLPFWRIKARVPVLDIDSYGDFAERTNQPFLVRPRWKGRAMSFWVPAFKLRPKVFLQAAKQATVNQWKLEPAKGRTRDNMFPVTLPAAEARQSLKLVLAVTTTSPRQIFPLLPQVQFQVDKLQLVHLPFVDQGHDWVQPATGIAVGKNILRFGRSM